MRTGRSFTVCRGCFLPGGLCFLLGVLPSRVGASFPGGVGVLPSHWCFLPSMHWGRPPVDRITDTSKNITLATTSLRPVINLNWTKVQSVRPILNKNHRAHLLSVMSESTIFCFKINWTKVQLIGPSHFCCQMFTASTQLLLPSNEVCEGYVFTPVCQSFCSQGGTWARTPPWAGTPLGRYTPSGRYPMGRYTPPGQVHPLG